MFANERRVKIAEMLERRSSVTVAELTDAFQVSLETIRRDLEYLERQGALKRVHGGAITVRKSRATAASLPVSRSTGRKRGGWLWQQFLISVRGTVFPWIRDPLLLSWRHCFVSIFMSLPW